MHSNGTKVSVTVKGSLPSPQNTSPSDSESEVLVEIERKRKQVEEEISNFREQKEREFRDFERDLQACRRRKTNPSPPTDGKSIRMLDNKPPSRTSSSSALNLLAGRGAPKQSQLSVSSKPKGEPLSTKNTSAKAGPSLSQAVVSLDKQNIRGEHAPLPARPQTPPTPTALPRNLPRSSSGSLLATSKLRVGKQPSSPPQAEKIVSPEDDKHRNSFTGLFTPSYLPLLEGSSSTDETSTSALITPPVEDEAATAPSSYRKNPLSEALPMTSSSFPPHVTLSPGGHAYTSKRAYTAPTVSSTRIPSALRTASGGAIGRKRKHVTFRLADSAIVEPSSSYEEGPSPQFEDGSTQSPKSGTRSPLRISKSQLHRTLSPDEEDEEAGVRPGMGMGDVIQRLNDFTVAEAAKHGEKIVLEVEDKQESDGDDDDDDDEDDDDDDLPMVMPSTHQDNMEDDSDRHFDVEYHEHEDDSQTDNVGIEEDGYFSPKNKHISTIPPKTGGHSPLAPYRNEDWAELSSSDKDRLLFEARRHSDDSDELNKRNAKAASPACSESGFAGGLKHNVDGGSGVGFFELDEELASPEAGQARPFQFDNDAEDADDTDDADADADDVDVADKDKSDTVNKPAGLGLLTVSASQGVSASQRKRWSSESASKLGVGSVPIDIVRPSLSVSSSWVGTFGH